MKNNHHKKEKLLAIFASTVILITLILEFSLSSKIEQQKMQQNLIIDARESYRDSLVFFMRHILALDNESPKKDEEVFFSKYYRNVFSAIPRSFWMKLAIDASEIDEATVILSSVLHRYEEDFDKDGFELKEAEFITKSKKDLKKLFTHLKSDIEQKILRIKKVDSDKRYFLEKNLTHVKDHEKLSKNIFDEFGRTVSLYQAYQKKVSIHYQKEQSCIDLLTSFKKFFLTLSTILSLSSVFFSYKSIGT